MFAGAYLGGICATVPLWPDHKTFLLNYAIGPMEVFPFTNPRVDMPLNVNKQI
jgi:hypothetical protein